MNEKVIVYGKTEREARRFFKPSAGQTVSYRAASDFIKPEKADIVFYAGNFPEIKEAYDKKSKSKEVKDDKQND